jgi:glycosyltransferase involved in cell wall biosynthesis
MKIGIFIQAYLPKIGGAQLSTHCLANSLIKLGHDVIIFTENSLANDCKEKNWIFDYKLVGIEIPRNFLRKVSSRIWKNKISRLLNNAVLEHKLDIIQIVNAWPWLCFEKKNLKFHIPIILRAVGDDIQKNEQLDYGILRNPDIAELIISGYKEITYSIANSKTTEEEYLNIGLPKNRIRVITPGVSNNLFKSISINKMNVLEKYGFPKRKKIIIAVGRNHQKKGYDYLVDSLKYLNKKKNNFILIIIGKNTNNLNKRASDIKQEDNFFPIQEISSESSNDLTAFPSKEIIELYKISDYFVLPSLLETFGNVKLEAMASGIPVITTDAPGARDAIENKINGLVVKPYSPIEISNAIKSLENDFELKSMLIKNGSAYAEQQDWDNVALQYLQLYDDAKKQID